MDKLKTILRFAHKDDKAYRDVRDLTATTKTKKEKHNGRTE